MEAILIVSSALLWLGLGLNMAVTLALVRRVKGAPGLTGGLSQGSPAPEFSAQTLRGETVSLANYAGHAAAFLFVSPSCAPCREEAPALEALAPAARRAGVELVLVCDATADETQVFVEELKLTLPVLVAPRNTSSFNQDYQVPGTPFYTLVSAQGTIEATGFLSLMGGTWKQLAASWQAQQARLPALTPAGR